MNDHPVTSTNLSLVYQGGAASNHMMDIREVAPALSAIRSVFERANAVVNGNTAIIELQMSTPRSSSFEIPLLLSLYQSGVSVFGGELVNSLFNIKAIVVGLISMLKIIQPNDSDDSESVDDSVSLSIGELRSGHILLRNVEVDAKPGALRQVGAMLATLMEDRTARKGVYDLVAPVRNYCVDQMLLRDETGELESVSIGDIPRFELPTTRGLISDSISRQFLKITSINFGSRPRHWKLNDGSKDSQYTIQDDVFLADVKNGLYHFADGDMLECDVRSIQHFTHRFTGNIRKEYEITKVWKHISVSASGP